MSSMVSSSERARSRPASLEETYLCVCCRVGRRRRLGGPLCHCQLLTRLLRSGLCGAHAGTSASLLNLSLSRNQGSRFHSRSRGRGRLLRRFSGLRRRGKLRWGLLHVPRSLDVLRPLLQPLEHCTADRAVVRGLELVPGQHAVLATVVAVLENQFTLVAAGELCCFVFRLGHTEAR